MSETTSGRAAARPRGSGLSPGAGRGIVALKETDVVLAVAWDVRGARRREVPVRVEEEKALDRRAHRARQSSLSSVDLPRPGLADDERVLGAGHRARPRARAGRGGRGLLGGMVDGVAFVKVNGASGCRPLRVQVPAREYHGRTPLAPWAGAFPA